MLSEGYLLEIGAIIVAALWCNMLIIGWAQKRREVRRRVAQNLYDLLDALDADRDAVLDDMAQGGKR